MKNLPWELKVKILRYLTVIDLQCLEQHPDFMQTVNCYFMTTYSPGITIRPADYMSHDKHSVGISGTKSKKSTYSTPMI